MVSNTSTVAAVVAALVVSRSGSGHGVSISGSTISLISNLSLNASLNKLGLGLVIVKSGEVFDR